METQDDQFSGDRMVDSGLSPSRRTLAARRHLARCSGLLGLVAFPSGFLLVILCGHIFGWIGIVVAAALGLAGAFIVPVSGLIHARRGGGGMFLPIIALVLNAVILYTAGVRLWADFTEHHAWEDLRSGTRQLSRELMEHISANEYRFPDKQGLKRFMEAYASKKQDLVEYPIVLHGRPLAVNRAVLGMDMRSLPDRTVLLFECRQDTGLVGGPGDIALNGVGDIPPLVVMYSRGETYLAFAAVGENLRWSVPSVPRSAKGFEPNALKEGTHGSGREDSTNAIERSDRCSDVLR